MATSQVHGEQRVGKAKHTAAKYAPIYTAYRKECQELIRAHRIKTQPVIDMKRTAKQVKYLSSEYGVNTVAKCIHTAASDWWVVSHGFALSTILATKVFNRLLNGSSSPQASPEVATLLAAYREEREALIKAGRVKAPPSIPKDIAELAVPLVKKYGVNTVAKCIHTAASRSWIVNVGFRLETILNSQAFSLLLPSEEVDDE